jgi:hypothetical protein
MIQKKGSSQVPQWGPEMESNHRTYTGFLENKNFIGTWLEDKVLQRQTMSHPNISTVGSDGCMLPSDVRERFESISGFSLTDELVYYNSGEPAKFGALAYTRGDTIYIGPDQEKYLEHEVGHVIQQKAGIVEPTIHVNGVSINDDPVLEHEVDNISNMVAYNSDRPNAIKQVYSTQGVVQRRAWVAVRPLDTNKKNKRKDVPLKNMDEVPEAKNSNMWLFSNLRFEHKQIIFDKDVEGLPDRKPLHGSTGNHDIGYRASNNKWRGPGQLFSDVLGGYTKLAKPISNNDTEDRLLVKAINTIGTKGRFNTYNLVLSNCQNWVTAVIKEYNKLKLTDTT